MADEGASDHLTNKQEEIVQKCALSCTEMDKSDDRGYRKVVFLIGAGASTSAGIPDFRSKGGLYDRYGPDLFHRLTLEHFPQKIYDFYREFAKQDYAPTSVHKALARLNVVKRLRGVVTQNIDGLEEQAGVDTDLVHCVHGSLSRFRCSRSFCDGFLTAKEYKALIPSHETPPKCFMCGQDSLLRPDIVLFGESLNSATLGDALRALVSCDLFVCVGTSLRVQPIASLPIEHVSRDAHRIWINRDAPPDVYQENGFFDLCIQDECDNAIENLFPDLVQ